MAGDDDISATIERLMADLEIEPENGTGVASASLEPEFAPLLAMQPAQFVRIALDAAVFVGFAGDWALSLRFANKLLELNDDRIVIKLWQLRCLVELKRYAEAVALSSSQRWPTEHMVHVNFLTGNALESLGLREQAQTRYRAVSDANATYRDVALRLLSR